MTTYLKRILGNLIMTLADAAGAKYFVIEDSGGTDLLRVYSDGAFALADGITAPPTRSGWAQIYVDTADGDLKVKFGDGTTKTLATDT